MNPTTTLQTLDELLGILSCSLPAYLADAKPWTPLSDRQQKLQAAIGRLAADQQRYAERVREAIVSLGGRPDPGRFPQSFAAKNDLSIEFLRREIVERQQHDIEAVARCAAALAETASLHALAEEILGNAEGHFDILKEMTKDE
jgi:hypothetical protein